MVVHPETIETVRLLTQYQYRGIDMKALVCLLLDEIDDEMYDEDRRDQATQLLGFAISNPLFIQAFFWKGIILHGKKQRALNPS